MGCTAAKPGIMNVELEYRNRHLPIPEATEYENDFEKEAYMTINILRNDPKFFIPLVRRLKGKFKNPT